MPVFCNLGAVSRAEKYSELSENDTKAVLCNYARKQTYSQELLASVLPDTTGYTAKKLIEWGITSEFAELVTAASQELHIPPGIIDKDYYVTLTLRELSNRIPGMVFKGGTSLTKCYQILDRFSEDIDISYSASDGVPSESRKRQLKKAVVSAMDSLQFSIVNLKETRSRRSYNCYRAAYRILFSPSISYCRANG